MTQKEKRLLLIDLCARLPYGIIIRTTHINGGKEYHEETDGKYFTCDEFSLVEYLEFYDNWKPYLRPMSSMTDDERKELSIILNYEFYIDDDFALVAEDDRHRIRLELCEGYIGWLNEHHFDYRGLIEKGLALEAKPEMYKI